MNRIRLACAVVALTFSASFVTAQAADRAMQDAIERIGNKSYKHLKVGVGRLTFEYSGLSGNFAQYLEDFVATALSRSTTMGLFKPIGEESVQKKDRDIYKDLYTSTGPEGLLTGKWFDEGDSVRFQFEVYDFSFSSLVGREEVKIPKTNLPRSLSVKPDDLDRAKALGLLSAPDKNEGLRVEIGFDKGVNPVYRDGDYLTVYLFANRDCYVRMFAVNARGEISQIFPNQFYRKDRIKGNELVRIPDDSYPFKFLMEAPYGTEYVKVLASEEPFAGTEEAFTSLGVDTAGVLTRQITVVQKKANAVKEVLGSYKILPR